MPETLLFNNFKKYIQLTATEEEAIRSLVTRNKYEKGDMLSREGEVNRYTHFIIEGSVRVYYVDQEGQQHVVQLGIQDWWVSDYASFITQQPAQLQVEALEPTETYSFSYDRLQDAYIQIPALERFFRLLIQKAYASFQQRILQSLSMDATQRYESFRQQYPEMDRQIAQKHIASYLGMSAEFLSKVKKRIMQRDKSLRKRIS
ncbi:MAG: Crp/Fnr family transcriptional regulator [Chitinophagaceae bacterium]|nr:Crp/Fnr family transcriptional regulator [Chitinophagaceae bacterium]